ncbi:MAG: hemolysin family protein [Planctomycetota bacterium]
MSNAQLFWTSFFALAATAIVSLGARALRNFSRHDLEEIASRRGQPDRFSEVLRLHETIALGVEMLGILSGALGIVTGSWWAAQRWGIAQSGSLSELLAISMGLGLVLAVAVSWLPWTVARMSAARFIFHTWPLWQVLASLAAPLVWGARMVDIALHRVVGRAPRSVDEETVEEEIRAIVTDGHRGGLLEEDAREMIEGVIELGDADVSEIMTPRTDMHMLSVDMPWDEMVADVIEAGHTRIPVFDENRDDIIGVLYSKDLLPELATGEEGSRTPIRDLIRKPVFVPQTKPVDDLLQMFQQLRTHIAVVLDEYGGVSGLVTIEDVLEEIVGEIVDEYDDEAVQEIQLLDADTCEALGRAHVDEINEKMRLELPEDGEFDTIAGFVFTELGRVPLVGESLVWQDHVRIEVVDASRRRIERVRIKRLDADRLESA